MKNFDKIFKTNMEEWGKIQFRFITKDFKKIYIVEQEQDDTSFLNSFIIKELITKDGKTDFLKNEIADTDEVADFMVDFLESLVKLTKKYGEPETVNKLWFVTFKF